MAGIFGNGGDVARFERPKLKSIGDKVLGVSSQSDAGPLNSSTTDDSLQATNSAGRYTDGAIFSDHVDQIAYGHFRHGVPLHGRKRTLSEPFVLFEQDIIHRHAVGRFKQPLSDPDVLQQSRESGECLDVRTVF